jgi:hypothetical protein
VPDCCLIAGERQGRRREKERKKIKETMGPTFGGGMEGLKEWRVRVGIWRSMENEGSYRGPAGVVFLPKAFKFWSRGPYRGPHWSCSDSL